MTDIIFNSGTTLTNPAITIDLGDRLIFGPSTHATVDGASYIVGSGTFINEGILVSSFFSDPGSFLEIDTEFVNYGTITGLDNLVLRGSLTNYGTIALGSGQISFYFDTDTPSLLTDLTRVSGQIYYGATLDNAGQTLDLSSLGLTGLTGRIDGGVLTGGMANFNEVLNGVTVGPNFGISSTVDVENGLTFAAVYPNQAHLTIGTGGDLHFVGSQTLDDNSHPYFSSILSLYSNGQAGPAPTLSGDQLAITSGSYITVTGEGLFAGGTIENAGTIRPDLQATIDITADRFLNSGEIGFDQGLLRLRGGAFENTGTMFLFEGSTIAIEAGSVDLGYVRLPSREETIRDDITSAGTIAPLTGTLSDFGGSDRILFPYLLYSDGDTASYVDGTLTITDDGTTIASLAITGTYAAGFFHIEEAYPGGFGIEVVACYGRGTMILTPAGEVPVETLRIGDLVTTLSGAARPVKWIGRRSYDGRFIAERRDILPIRFRAGSLGAGVPHRDLLVSPHHAMLLDGVLVPAEKLINGVSVLQEASVETVEYFHIELDSHDVLVAEGAASESFVDCDSRGVFQNAAEFTALYPDDAAERWRFCAPRVENGAPLDAIRRAIDRRAGLIAPAGNLLGQIDEAGAARITGWACDAGRPGLPLTLRIEIDGEEAGLVLAGLYRADLESAGYGPGRCGFAVDLPPIARRARLVRLLRAADGAELAGSPVLIPALARDQAVAGGDAAVAHLLRKANQLAQCGAACRWETAAAR